MIISFDIFKLSLNVIRRFWLRCFQFCRCTLFFTRFMPMCSLSCKHRYYFFCISSVINLNPTDLHSSIQTLYLSWEIDNDDRGHAPGKKIEQFRMHVLSFCFCWHKDTILIFTLAFCNIVIYIGNVIQINNIVIPKAVLSKRVYSLHQQ